MMRKALYLTCLFLVLAGTVFFLFRSWLRQGETAVNPEIRMKGDHAFIIRREEAEGKIHVNLSREEDFFQALGFAQAWAVGDRMMYLRLCAGGQLSRYFGGEYKEDDAYLSAWQFEDLATKTLSNLPDETRENLEHFVRGINQRFSNLPPPSGCRWYHVDTTPWTPEDVLAVWHLLRWSQFENWSLPFFIRYTEIYYGRQVKKQFEAILDVTIPDFEPGHIRDFMAFCKLDRDVRRKVGLMTVFPEQGMEGIPLFGYSGGENEDWTEMTVCVDSSRSQIILHTGLPLFFYGNKGFASPARCDFIPVEPASAPGEETAGPEMTIRVEMAEFAIQFPARLFDISGKVFAHLMERDSLNVRLLKDFSYAVSAGATGHDSVPAMIMGSSEKELAAEMRRRYPDHEALKRLSQTEDPALWGAFISTLLDKVYRDDLQVIYPDLALWPGEHPELFLKHLMMMMMNPYSAWWDDRQTPNVVERMDDVFAGIGETLFTQYGQGELSVHIDEIRGHPLGRFHVLTGAYRRFPKSIKIPIAVTRKDDGAFHYSRFVFIPDNKSSENLMK